MSKCMDYDWGVKPPTAAEIAAGKFVEWRETTKEGVHELYVHNGPSRDIVMFSKNCQLETAFGAMHAVMHTEGATKQEIEQVWTRHKKQTF